MSLSGPDCRKIIHVDMDAFYASVEQKDHPETRGKPLVVGGIGSRSVVAAASYEARQFGIHSAMSMAQAKRLCPQAIVMAPRMQRYKEISSQIHGIFKKYTEMVEPLALDEAWLDVTVNTQRIPSATWVATHIKWDIENQLGLTSSAGVSYNKFLAKIASGIDKPNGLFVIPPEEALEFLSGLHLSKIPGVGKVTAAKLKGMGFEFGHQLLGVSSQELIAGFGKFGGQLYQLIRGQDDRVVESKRTRKSVGVEQTFSNDMGGGVVLDRALDMLFQRLWTRLKPEKRRPRAVTLKVKFADFSVITRSSSDPAGLTHLQIKKLAQRHLALVHQTHPNALFRLLGISVSSFEGSKPQKIPPGQLDLFSYVDLTNLPSEF